MKKVILGFVLVSVFIATVLYCIVALYFEYELRGISDIKKGEVLSYEFTMSRMTHMLLSIEDSDSEIGNFRIEYTLTDPKGRPFRTGDWCDEYLNTGLVGSGTFRLEFRLLHGSLAPYKNKKIILSFPTINDPFIGRGIVLHRGFRNAKRSD